VRNPVASQGSHQTREKPKAEAKERTALWTACAAAVLLLLAAYSNHFHNGFHFDDAHVIETNLFIRSLGNIPRFFTDGTTFSSLPANSTYRPLLSTTYAIDYALAGGLVPFQFHLTQFLLLLTLAALLFLLFNDLMDRARPRPLNAWLALFATTFFCIHTANTETVNYLSSRSDLLSTLFVVLAFILYLKSDRARSLHLYLIPIALGTLVKVPAVMFGPLLILYLWLFETAVRGSSILSRTVQAIRKGLPALVVSVILFFFQARMTPSTWAPSEFGPIDYLRTQFFVWLHYVRLFVLPIGLSADTDYGIIPTWYDTRVLAGIAMIALLSWIFWTTSQRREHAPIAFGLAWFALALLPTSSVFPLAEAANEHRLFFAYIGLTLSSVWTIAEALRGPLSLKTDRTAARAIAVVAVAVLLAHAIGTYSRNRVWENGETLWLDVTRKSPSNGRGLMNYGLTQMQAGRYEIAKDYFIRARQLTPNYSNLEINLGIVTAAMGDHAAAEPHFKRAMELNPDANANLFYARWLVERGRAPEAIPMLREAIRLSAADPASRELLMSVYAARGSATELKDLALRTLEIAPQNAAARAYAGGTYPLEVTGTDAKTWFDHGARSIGKSRFLEAAQANRAALLLAPDDPNALNNLGWSLAKLGFYPEAVAAFEAALRAAPDYELARNNLAWARSQKQ
jgi:tetratricopeptide (TPR) repeat protein